MTSENPRVTSPASLSSSPPELEAEAVADVEVDTTSDPSPANALLQELSRTFEQGDFKKAKALVIRLEQSLHDAPLNEQEEQAFQELRQRLSLDLAEVFVPISLFILWAILFWRTLH